MKVRCIKNVSHPASLTIGKIYEAELEVRGFCYRLVDDMQDGEYLYPIHWFEKETQCSSDC